MKEEWVEIGGRKVKKDTLDIYVDFKWADEGLSGETLGMTLRRDATSTDIHNELLEQAGLANSIPYGPAYDTFTRAIHHYAETHKPRYVG